MFSSVHFSGFQFPPAAFSILNFGLPTPPGMGVLALGTKDTKDYAIGGCKINNTTRSSIREARATG
jgi:hypothetical protein